MSKKESIFIETTDKEIFDHFLRDFTNGKILTEGVKINSPLRNESNPSFNIYKSPSGWRYKDYGGDSGDCIDFVMKLHNLTFAQALSHINKEMQLGISDEPLTEEKHSSALKSIKGKEYELFYRDYSKTDLMFWGKFGITPEILTQYGVVAIELIEGISKKTSLPYKTKGDVNLMYGYLYSNSCMKIYQPFAPKQFKFYYKDPAEKDKDFVFGKEQIPKGESIVIWTGGEKDVLTLRGLGFFGITGTSETGAIPQKVIAELQRNGSEIIILFDNDETGTRKSLQFAKQFMIKRAVLPPMPPEGKDVSDYIKLKLEPNEIIKSINSAEFVSDDIISEGVIEEVPPNSNECEIKKISETEVTHDIWLITFSKDGRPIIKGLYRVGIMRTLKELGYYKRCRENGSFIFIQDEKNIISEVEVYMMKDAIYDKINDLTKGISISYNQITIEFSQDKLLETFHRQSHTIFNETFLTVLTNHEKPILRDNKTSAFFFFTNLVVEITKEGLKYFEYSELTELCIWKNQIRERSFEYVKENQDCHFAKFICNVTNNEVDRKAAFISAIGYLLHNYSHPTGGQAIIANDEEITDLKNPMGGTGKGLFASAIRQLRVVIKIDGKKFDPDDKFKFQNVTEDTQVIVFDDIKKDFAFETLHSCLTDGWVIEKKYCDQFLIKPEDSPKPLLNGNSVVQGGGTTNTRRQNIIEFSNHYSKKIKTGVEEPIKSEHGCTFFDKDDWDINEWNMFYSYMLDCTCFYLNNGLQYYEHKSLAQNRLRQGTSEEFCDWVIAQNFQPNVEYETTTYFKDFVTTFFGEASDFKQRGFTNWLGMFAVSRKWQFKAKRSNSVAKFVFLDQAVRQGGPLF